VALKPSDLSRLTEEEQADLKALETRIDRTLRESAKWSQNKHWISVSNTTPRIREEIAKIYRDAGWKVRWDDDQRDGMSMILETGS